MEAPRATAAVHRLLKERFQLSLQVACIATAFSLQCDQSLSPTSPLTVPGLVRLGVQGWGLGLGAFAPKPQP